MTAVDDRPDLERTGYWPEGEGTNEWIGVEALLRDCLRGVDRAAADVRRLRAQLIGGE